MCYLAATAMGSLKDTTSIQDGASNISDKEQVKEECCPAMLPQYTLPLSATKHERRGELWCWAQVQSL